VNSPSRRHGPEAPVVEGETELYVYYRAPASARHTVRASLLPALAGLMCERPGLSCRVLLRAAVPTAATGTPTIEPAAAVQAIDHEPVDTWMEIHQRAGGLSAADIARLSAALADLPAGRHGTRHDEFFRAEPAQPGAAAAASAPGARSAR
jgi:hypothetical protein